MSTDQLCFVVAGDAASVGRARARPEGECLVKVAHRRVQHRPRDPEGLHGSPAWSPRFVGRVETATERLVDHASATSTCAATSRRRARCASSGHRTRWRATTAGAHGARHPEQGRLLRRVHHAARRQPPPRRQTSRPRMPRSSSRAPIRRRAIRRAILREPGTLLTPPVCVSQARRRLPHRRAGIAEPCDRVAVVGDGKLGLLIAEVLGRHVHALTPRRLLVLLGRHTSKMGLLSADAGVETALAADALRAACFDVVVDATGSPAGPGSPASCCSRSARPCQDHVRGGRRLQHGALRRGRAQGRRLALQPVPARSQTARGRVGRSSSTRRTRSPRQPTPSRRRRRGRKVQIDQRRLGFLRSFIGLYVTSRRRLRRTHSEAAARSGRPTEGPAGAQKGAHVGPARSSATALDGPSWARGSA